jgi:hypothetical protein
VPDAHVVFNRELLNARDDVKVTDRYIVVEHAFAGVNDAEPDPNSFANSIPEKQTVHGAFEKRGEERDTGEHDPTRSACSRHKF